MRILTWPLLISMVFLAGCSGPTVDASTDESIKSSIANVRESLPEKKRTEFDEAIQLLAFSQLNFQSLITEDSAGIGKLKDTVKDAVHGKTGDQIIAEANQIIAEANQIKLDRERKEKEQAIQEIKEIEEKILISSKSRENLNKFEVLRSQFYKENKQYMGDRPVIELTVKNGTDHSISRAYFKGTLSSPKHNVPWHEDTFNYPIPGGLEPGEKANWRLEPNILDWGKVEVPKDAIFTVTVESLDGADGEALFAASEFSEREEKRLAELKEKYNIK